jgi:hypothetical protein
MRLPNKTTNKQENATRLGLAIQKQNRYFLALPAQSKLPPRGTHKTQYPKVPFNLHLSITICTKTSAMADS